MFRLRNNLTLAFYFARACYYATSSIKYQAMKRMNALLAVGMSTAALAGCGDSPYEAITVPDGTTDLGLSYDEKATDIKAVHNFQASNKDADAINCGGIKDINLLGADGYYPAVKQVIPVNKTESRVGCILIQSLHTGEAQIDHLARMAVRTVAP